jgi:hypothetical protein
MGGKPMTEKRWLKATDPAEMLEFLGQRAGDRKLRLFGCACCRRVWHIATMAKLKEALALLEDFIEGKAKDRDRGRAHKLGGEVLESRASDGQQCLGAEVWKAARKTFNRKEYKFYDFGESAAAGLGWAAGGVHPTFTTTKERERKEQAKLVRELFGNPFRPVAFSANWRTPDAMALARQIYESRYFGAMPILADALQDAGCDSDDILSHLRDPHATHVRGCWALDLVLGKE